MSDAVVEPVVEAEVEVETEGIMVVWNRGAIWNRRVLTTADVKAIAGTKATKNKGDLVWESENMHRLFIESPNDLLLEFFKDSSEFEIK